MFLRLLTLKGFKSFADPATLTLEPGVTVVVGPNGSGKSNVVDAIAWVLGAQAPSAVRSQKMDDVIFAGTARRPALGRAEVTLTLDNTSGILPIGFTEVTLRRTLFRSGDSEYAINGVPCRLLDMQELLSDAGVGRQQHVIVSQGQIDAVLNARPEDRRAIVEEAAGVLKFRKRKEKAERRLEGTESNLVRVQDLLREVRRQLRPLERQAEAARRHGGLTAELGALRVHLAGREIAGHRARLGGLTAEAQRVLSEQARTKGELSALDVEVMAVESELSALGGFALGDSLVRAEQLRERARGVAALAAERRRGLQRDLQQLVDTGLVAALEADAAGTEAELVEVTAAVAVLGPRAAELDAEEATVAAERPRPGGGGGDAAGGGAASDSAGDGGGAASDGAAGDGGGGGAAASDGAAGDGGDGGGGGAASDGAADGGRPSAASEAAAARSEARGLRAAVARAAAELDRAERRRSALVTKADRLAADEAVAAAEVRASEAAAAAAGTAMAAAEADWAAATTEAEEAERGLAVAMAERAGWRARADALASALDDARARAGVEALTGLDGVLGPLLELVAVDAGWEAAFEAAAGEALGAVVAAGPDSARRALGALATAATPGAVLPLPAVSRSPNSWGLMTAGRHEPPTVEGKRQSVRAHVRAAAGAASDVEAGVDALLDQLLDGVIAVDGGWRAAVDIALLHPNALVVTMDGDRLSRHGWRLGAAGSGATGAALDEARREAEASAADHDRCAAEAEAARARLATARRDEARCRHDQARTDAALAQARDRLAHLRTQAPEVAAEVEQLTLPLAGITADAEQDRARLAALDARLPALEAAEAAEQAAAREASALRTRWEERAAAVAVKRRDLEVEAAGLEQRRVMLTSRRADIERRLAADGVARAEAARRREGVERAVAAVDRLGAVVAIHAERLDAEVTDLHERRRRQSEAARAVAARLDDLRQRRAGAEAELERVRERSRRVELDAAEVTLRLETAVDSLRRDLDTDPETAAALPCPPLPDGVTAAGRARELERELRLLGPINPLALEEFTELQERHQFLETQLDDVKTSRRELMRVIRAIDTEIQQTFAAAYADVASHFATLFTALFPGGMGRLVLTQPDDLLNTGLEVEAKPSGKNVKKLSLLSGGERSLTALAFLFAVFRARPSPFYVMDEVEAALDDVNLHRFLALLSEFRDEAQLIVVSHQKRTMEAADCLFGVTMQPGGSSQVVSERVTSGA